MTRAEEGRLEISVGRAASARCGYRFRPLQGAPGAETRETGRTASPKRNRPPRRWGTDPGSDQTACMRRRRSPGDWAFSDPGVCMAGPVSPIEDHRPRFVIGGGLPCGTAAPSSPRHSIPGHCAVASRELFRHFAEGKATLVISDITLLELAPAPERIRRFVDSVPTEYVDEVKLTPEAEDLAGSYIFSGVIGAASKTDAEHIATATIHRVTVLVSWNFKHIVNLERIHGFNSVNLRLGYPMLEIRTPMQVIGHEG